MNTGAKKERYNCYYTKACSHNEVLNIGTMQWCTAEKQRSSRREWSYHDTAISRLLFYLSPLLPLSSTPYQTLIVLHTQTFIQWTSFSTFWVVLQGITLLLSSSLPVQGGFLVKQKLECSAFFFTQASLFCRHPFSSACSPPLIDMQTTLDSGSNGGNCQSHFC